MACLKACVWVPQTTTMDATMLMIGFRSWRGVNSRTYIQIEGKNMEGMTEICLKYARVFFVDVFKFVCVQVRV